ncbi:tRNA (adenosine(37)-N6)-threonylcarbamoyltransferase complex ATPase subunit type 1 TsaE [Demequina litorisediminis]
MIDATVTIPDAEAMRAFAARQVAPLLRPGDLLILSGDLGAGKTTFTQGLGEAIGVRGPVASPTFIIARTHPSEVGGPGLIHVDAYRLGSLAEARRPRPRLDPGGLHHRGRVGRGQG